MNPLPASENPSGAIAVSTLLIIFAGLLLFFTYASVQYRFVYRKYAERPPHKHELPNPRSLRKHDSVNAQRTAKFRYIPRPREPLDTDAPDPTVEAGIPDWQYDAEYDAHGLNQSGLGQHVGMAASFSYRRECQEAWTTVQGLMRLAGDGMGRRPEESVAEFLLRAGNELKVDPEIAQKAARGHERAAYSSAPWTRAEYTAYQGFIDAYREAAERRDSTARAQLGL